MRFSAQATQSHLGKVADEMVVHRFHRSPRVVLCPISPGVGVIDGRDLAVIAVCMGGFGVVEV